MFNKYISKEQKLRINFLKGLAVGLILLLLAILLYQAYFIPNIKASTRQDALENYEKAQGKEVLTYEINKKMKAGQPIDIDKDLTLVRKPINSVPDDYVKDRQQLKGMATRIVLGKNTIVSSDMFVKLTEYITNDLKYQDYSHIVINAFEKKGDYVDIRYKKKDGTDYVVVAKKLIRELNGNTIGININEEERMYLNNATVECDLTGGTLYTTIYPDPLNQEPAQVTYQLNDNIKKMIEQNSDIVKTSEQNIENKNTVATNEVTQKPAFIGGSSSK